MYGLRYKYIRIKDQQIFLKMVKIFGIDLRHKFKQINEVFNHKKRGINPLTKDHSRQL